MPCTHCGREHAPGTKTCPLTGQSMASPGMIGKQIDRYRIESLLGSGGFGNVYRARHVHTDATVALKLLKPQLGADAESLERFLREAKAATAVGNPHIVRVLDATAVDGQALIAFELLDGWDLKELANREGPLPVARVVELICQALDGLAAAHAKGVVHRDIKPANVFVTHETRDGVEADFVKLLDFGISKFHSDNASGLTATGMAIGTPSYMAPEQFFDAKSVDARADLYSVAVILYELLGGRLPYTGNSYAEVVVKAKSETPPPLLSVNPSVPPALAAVVDKGLSKAAVQRFSTAKELANALRVAMQGTGMNRVPAMPVVAPQNLATPTPVRGGFNLAGPAPVALEPTLRPQAPALPIRPGAPIPSAPPAPIAAPPPAKKSNPVLWIAIGVLVFLFSSCFFTGLMLDLINQGD
ncbi:MAG: serine/threonine-protein kinase [Myxococcaceae bacterium]